MSKFDSTAFEHNKNSLRLRQVAEDESAYGANVYRQQRPYLNTGAEAVIELARLDYLYRDASQSLSRVFTGEEFSILVARFRGEIFTPQRIRRMASLFQFSSIFSGQLFNPTEERLYEKLQRLSPAQLLILADTLEQLWYRAPETGGQVELLAELGIKLRQ